MPDSSSNEKWLEAIVRSVDERPVMIDGIVLPGFPPPKIRNLTVTDGTSPKMLAAASSLHAKICAAGERHGVPLGPGTRLLDFGCAWGRIARFFLREVGLAGLYGVDVLPRLVDACRETFGSDQFFPIQQAGNLPFEDGFFDVVFANSVFSHLTEPLNFKWFAEIRRVLRPGGLAALTVLDEDKFLRMAKADTPYFKAFEFDVAATRQALDEGTFIWRSTGRAGQLDGYGIAFIPAAWLDMHWRPLMPILSVDSDYAQSIIFLQKQG